MHGIDFFYCFANFASYIVIWFYYLVEVAFFTLYTKYSVGFGFHDNISLQVR